MQILKLEVEGYRSLRHVTWEPAALNVIIGPNGSGKSNLLRLLELLATSAKGHLGKYIMDAGGMDPMVWDGKAEVICFSVMTSAVEVDLEEQHENLIYKLELQRIGQGSAYRIGYELLQHSLDGGVLWPIKHDDITIDFQPGKIIQRDQSHAIINDFDSSRNIYIGKNGQIHEEETMLSMMSSPFIQNQLIPSYQQQMASWAIYHDVHVDQDAPIRKPAVTRSSKLVDADGQNLIHVLHTLYSTDREFEEEINSAMRAAFSNDFDKLVFPPDADQRIQLRLRWKSLKREVSAMDISDGTLRFLFLLTVLASPNPAPLIAIDEPETGLHPSMLPIIAEYAAEASTRAQIILTTHSPQLLDAFTNKRPTSTVTVTKCENGETKLTKISGEALDYWLAEYSLGTLYVSGQLEDME